MDKKEFDLMVVGELNVDIILDDINRPPEPGKEQRAGTMALTMGSSSAIFAINCSSLGLEVAFCGKTGRDTFGDFIMDSLSARGINSESVIIDESLKTGATIILNHNNDRMMVTHPGAMEHMTTEEVPEDLYRRSRHLHTSAIFFQPGIKRNIEDLFRKAKEHGLSTSMDTQWDPDENWDLDLDKLLPQLDFFLPNEQELIHLTGTSTLDEALTKLSRFNTVIVVKRGTKGAVMQQNGKRTSISACKLPGYADAIGAGDSFNAGFIRSYLNDLDLKECLSFGNLAAAVSTTAFGGTDAIRSYRQVVEIGKSIKSNAI